MAPVPKGMGDKGEDKGLQRGQENSTFIYFLPYPLQSYQKWGAFRKDALWEGVRGRGKGAPPLRAGLRGCAPPVARRREERHANTREARGILCNSPEGRGYGGGAKGLPRLLSGCSMLPDGRRPRGRSAEGLRPGKGGRGGGAKGLPPGSACRGLDAHCRGFGPRAILDYVYIALALLNHNRC